MTKTSIDSVAGTISPVSLRALAVYAPLLLFASGILRWVDRFDGLPEVGLPWVFAQALLVAALLCFAFLSKVVVAEARRLSAASWILLAGGTATIALTRELLPLAALLILIGLAPLCAEREDGSEPASQPAPARPRAQQVQGTTGSGHV
jgi:hypothetical protein